LAFYAYQPVFIKQYVSMSPSGLEAIESLEQLRVLMALVKKFIVDIARQHRLQVLIAEDLVRLLAAAKASIRRCWLTQSA